MAKKEKEKKMPLDKQKLKKKYDINKAIPSQTLLYIYIYIKLINK